jgi:hypothetical protein
MPLANLPVGVRATAVVIWNAVRSLVEVERVCGCHPPGDPVMIAPGFIADWAGVKKDDAKDGLCRLRALEYLMKLDTVRVGGDEGTGKSGREVNRYLVRGHDGWA